MKLCVFQGTFNPIHVAHLKMADYVLKNYGFDKIIFIPAYRPPHKNYDITLTPHRLKMVELAALSNPNFKVSDIEYKNERNSYTYLTILELYKKYDIEGKINFIIGTDAFKKIDTWYEADKLKELVNFIVFVRENELDNKKYHELKEKGYNFTFAKMDFQDISSSNIRKNIREGHDISEFVTDKVKGYIEKNGLYKNK